MNPNIQSVIKHGIVEAFDVHRGLGTLNSEGETYLFHCAEIIDGTRDIAVNSRVSFVPVVRFGNREASVVTLLVAERP